jgi:hypothetical protein
VRFELQASGPTVKIAAKPELDEASLDELRKWARLDSNQEPTDYESAALTVELRALGLIIP